MTRLLSRGLPAGPRPLAASFAGWRALALAPGQRVRIRDGAGALLRATAGELWITEDRSHDDVVIGAGNAHRVHGDGTTIVEAQRESRLVIEVAPDARSPDAVELMPPPGVRGAPILVPLAHPWRQRVARTRWLGAAWRGAERAA